MQQQLLKKVCPIILLLVVFITAISFCFTHVHAGESFAENSAAWSNIQNSLYAKESDTYPYNSTTLSPYSSLSKGNVKAVPLDVLYGTTKGFGLTEYHGEVPYVQTYDGDNRTTGFGNKYAKPGTTIESGSKNNPGGVDAKTYWGFENGTVNGMSISKDANSAKLSDYEKINDSEIISLRLYALANTNGGFFGAIGSFFSNLLYMVGVGLASLATMLLSLIVTAKNIDIESIMNMLNLKGLSDIMTNNFIFNSDNLALSPFALFALIMFIFAIVVYAINYAKGRDRQNGLKDIILTALIGILVIGMCLSGNIVTLGSTAADAANKLMATIAGVTTSNSGNVFGTDINDSQNTNKVAQISEMSMINKIFIDMQICAQFGVSDINDLNVTKLGDYSAYLANEGCYYISGQKYQVGPTNGILMQYVDKSTTPTGVSNVNMMTEFNNNLGYYYWFANSSVSKKTVQNVVFPSTNSNVVEDKLDAIITYLQAIYNYNIKVNQTSQNAVIRNIILSLARPNGASGCLSLLLLTAILVIMGICLFKYCLNVMIGKLELFLSILGLAVAGPLMLTTNKKLVQTGKSIIGMIPVAFIEITIYSIIFDIIVYLVASLMSTNILQLLVLLFLIILLMKFNPVLQEKIKQLLDNTTRVISPTLSNTKRAIKTYTRQKVNGLINDYDKSKKVVGYDKDGNEIYKERGGNALSKLMHQGYNTIYNDGMQREGFRKINKQQNEINARNITKSNLEKRRDAEARINDTMNIINEDATALKSDVAIAEKEYQDNYYTVNGDEIIYNEDNLSEEEKLKVQEIVNMKAEAESIKNNATYKKLMAEKNYIDAQNNAHKNEEGYELKKFDEAKLQKLESLTNQANDKIKIASELNASLKQSIDNRAIDYAYDKVGLDKNVEGANSTEKLNNATILKAQQQHYDELHKALQDGINTIREEVNTKQSAKIGSSSATVNKDAITSSATMMYKKKQLEDGKAVHIDSNDQQNINHIVGTIVKRNDSNNNSDKDKLDKAKNGLSRAQSIHDEDKRNEAVENANNNIEAIKEEIKADKKEGKDNYKASKKENGKVIPATIDEQLNTMINNYNSNKSSTNNDLAKTVLTKAKEKEDTQNVEVSTEQPTNSSTTSSTSSTSTATTPTPKSKDRWEQIEETDKAEAANNKQMQAQPQVQPQPQVQSQPKNTTNINLNKNQNNNQSNNQNNNQNNQNNNQSNNQSNNQNNNQSNNQSNNTHQSQSNNQTNIKLNPQQNSQSTAQQSNQKSTQEVQKANTQSNQQQSTQSVAQQVNQIQQNVDNRAQFSKNASTQANNSSIQDTIQKHEANNAKPQVEKPQVEKPQIEKPQVEKPQNNKVHIEDVRPIQKDRADYTKDEGREYLANEELRKKDINDSSNSGGDFWSKRRS